MKLIKIGLISVLILLIAYQTAIYKSTQLNSGNAPIISSDVDEIHIPCRYSKEDLLQGLTAYDVEDGYLTEKILIGGFSDFTERGVSSLEYAVYDKDGNIAVFNRKVVFIDYVPPRIAMKDPWVCRATENAYYYPSLTLDGSDMLDGDISKHILITSTDLDFSKPGKYTASVYLKNSFGDEVSMDLPIHVVDAWQSGYVIELTEPLVYAETGETILPERYVAAVRNEYTGEILPIDLSERTYTASVFLKNSVSDEGTMDLSAYMPDFGHGGYNIGLTEPLIYVEKGETIGPEEYTDSVRDEHTIEIIPGTGYELTIHSFVDTSKDGIYEIQFSAVSTDKVQRGETWMTVVVGDYGG